MPLPRGAAEPPGSLATHDTVDVCDDATVSGHLYDIPVTEGDGDTFGWRRSSLPKERDVV